MRRRAAKVDANQPDIVDAFRACGLSVAITSAAGQGFPDLVVGGYGVNALVEVKDGNKSPSRRALTGCQLEFRDEWRGWYEIVESVAQAVDLAARMRVAGGALSRLTSSHEFVTVEVGEL